MFRSTKAITLEETTAKFKEIQVKIEELLHSVGNAMDNVQYDRENLDESFLRDQYYYLTDKLESIHHRLSYLSKPVTDQGFIKHNELKRYELPSGQYFTSGSSCEILVNDERFNEQYWVYTTIEHNGEDYYATSLGRDKSINGMMVRVRS